MSTAVTQLADAQHPWIGLASFTERNCEFFAGRGEEVDELLRLVRRDTLTLLYGVSGLGKTSLLQAGLFPALREENVLPVPIRLDYMEGASPLAAQVIGALFSAANAAGAEPPQARAGETLWEYFHRDGNHFWSSRNELVTPLLVFDQFEEAFTLGRENPGRARRVAEFFTEFADLVENRPPAALREDPQRVKEFTFKTVPIKILLAMREDYLADLDRIRSQFRALDQNRLRLQPMNARQAQQVIALGSPLLAPGVADRIVTFTAGGCAADGEELSVAPALLSLVLRELNERRLARGPDAKITADLLDIEQQKILEDFYLRTLQDFPVSVRNFIEDELLTATGYRNSCALDDALARLEVTLPILNELVNRRLLAYEDRHRVRRVEITHDVLAPVIKTSRDTRLTREALAKAEQQKLEAREKERAAWRRTAILMTFLVLALGAAAYGLRESLLARDREQKALAQTKLAEESARIAEQAKRDAIESAAEAKKQGEAAKQQSAIAASQATLAFSRQLAGLADNAVQLGDVQRAALFAATGYQIAPGYETRQSLEKSLMAQPELHAYLSGHLDSVWCVAFSPDGRTLASASSDNTIILWDVASRKPLGKPLAGHREAVYSVAFSPDGKTLASGSDDKTVILWEVASRKPLGEPLQGHLNRVSSVAFSPDGKTLASASSDRTVILWDLASRKPLGKPLTAHKGNIEYVAFSPDGKTLATASDDKTVILWDMATRKPLGKPLAGHRNLVMSVAFSPDGKMLASASSDQTMILWDVASRKRLGDPFGGNTALYAVAFSPDGRMLASGGYDNTVTLWDVATRQALGDTLDGHQSDVTSVAFSPDGKTLASGSMDKNVILWDVARRKPLDETLEGHKDDVQASVFSPDGKTLASGSMDNNVILWDVARRKPLGKPLNGHRDTVNSVAFSPDGRTLASASSDKTVILWDVAGRTQLGTPLAGHREALDCVAFSPDGKTLASGSDDHTVILWDVASRTPLGEPLEGNQNTVFCVAFSPDGKTLASGHFNGAVVLWDVASRTMLGKPLPGYEGKALAVAFSPDGRTLASGHYTGAVILWDVATGKRLGQPLTGHKSEVYHLAFSPDGRTLASGSNDGTVILWDVAGRRYLHTPLIGHSTAVTGITFSPDGKVLTSVSFEEDKNLYHPKLGVAFNLNGEALPLPSFDPDMLVWNMNEKLLLPKASTIANRNLTHGEWAKYVGEGVPHRVTFPELPVPQD